VCLGWVLRKNFAESYVCKKFGEGKLALSFDAEVVGLRRASPTKSEDLLPLSPQGLQQLVKRATADMQREGAQLFGANILDPKNFRWDLLEFKIIFIRF